MKNLLIILFLILLSAPVYAGEDEKQYTKNSSVIEDELLNESFISKIKPSKKVVRTEIKDELLEQELYKDSLFRLGISKKGTYRVIPIKDELINDDFKNYASKVVIVPKEIPDDFFIEKITDTKRVRKIKSKTKYDFSREQVPIHIKVAKQFKSTKGLMEGDDIPFIVQHDFEINGEKYKKGTKILGRIETISESDKMGVPECIKIDNFYLAGNEDIVFHGSISKTGANRAIWVYPLYQAGNICLYAAGFAFVPIHGGRAKILAKENFTIYYELQ